MKKSAIMPAAGMVLAFLPLFIMAGCSREKPLTIAMAQIVCLDGDREGNFIRIENAVSEAKEKGVDIVCFPETALLGWVNPDAHLRACPIPGEDSGRLSALAIEYDVFLCVGLAEKEGEKLYDSAVLIDNTGTILLRHRKINILTELMTPPYTPGSGVRAVDTRYGRIGLMICADSFLDGPLRKMKKLKPDLVLIPYGWAQVEEGWPEHAKQLRATVLNAAKTMEAPVVGTDLVGAITHGPWTGLVYGGASIAADRHGTVLAAGRDRDRDIVLVTIPR